MSRTFSGLLLVVSFWVPAAWPKDHPKDQQAPPAPLFIAREFHFSQIDTICVTPTLDLRADKTEPLALSAEPWRVKGFLTTLPPTADAALANLFNYIGYKTVSCNPVNATLDDLKAPSDAWLQKLDFGESRWLFILAVQDVPIQPLTDSWKTKKLQSHHVYAVVSGYLFEKQAAGNRLVWRDIAVGLLGDEFVGKKETVKLVESQDDIADGISNLLAKFETRNKNLNVGHFFKTPLKEVHTEIFDVTCNVLWIALNDTLKKSGKYDVLGVDDSDTIAVYMVGRIDLHFDWVILKSEQNNCAMQIMVSFPKERSHDAGDLIKRVQASLSK